MDIIYLIKDFIHTKNVQLWINNRYKDKNKVIVDSKLFPFVMMSRGEIFSTLSNLHLITQVFQDYNFSDIRKEDIVIDIGANIGGFSFPASKFSSKVFAFEPIEIEELNKNNKINGMKVKVIEGALGDGLEHRIKWLNTSTKIRTFSFTEIKKICGGCDFLKCDCEGFEWFIQPDELKGVRRIEMELHNYNPSSNNPNLLINHIIENYNTIFQKEGGTELSNFSMKFNKTKITDVMILHAIEK
ncbi:MAG: hypothetical protein LUQ37_04065 [Methanoregulaceae archaeon]|jgi:hypothetical protein|nr:hypothetical protein [Methanoregulaceae archaeon]